MKRKPEWITSNIKLSIGILVSNNIKTIRRCLDSLKPLLDSIASELIVVDTVKAGESDGSLAVAAEYTDKIYHFDWCNDFAKARNVCMEHACGEWFLYVDDDEWFDDVQELISFFRSGECDAYCQGDYRIRNYSADGGYTLSLVSRLFRRTATMQFVGKVHETINEVYFPKKIFSLQANHSGYVFETDELRLKKQQRNVTILEQEIKEKGINSGRAAQMVQELLSCPETATKGFETCMRYIVELKKMGQLENPSGQWILVAGVRYFSIVGNTEELFYQAEWIQNEFTLTEVAKVVLAVTVIFPAVKQDKMNLVENYCDMYFENWDWVKTHEQEAAKQYQLDFSAFFSEEYYQKIVYIAAVTANQKKDYRLANEYWKRMPWGQEGFDGSRFVRELQITIEGLKNM